MKIMKSYESNICEVNRSAVNQKLKGQKFKQRSEIHKLNNKILIANFLLLIPFYREYRNLRLPEAQGLQQHMNALEDEWGFPIHDTEGRIFGNDL